MTDQWDEQLRCPQCHNTGLASLSQFEDARMPTVDFVTAGFKAVQTELGPDLHCGNCNVPALP
jgi:cytochrome c-type biogenesis protein CcmH/NrfF